MDFSPTSAQAGDVASLRRYALEHVAPLAGRYSDALMTAADLKVFLKGLVPFGFIGGWIDDGQDGQGRDYLTSGLLYEELARSFPDLAAAALIAESSAASVARLGNAHLQRNVLPAMLRADLIGCIAISEPTAGSNPREMLTHAVADGRGWRINGEKTWVANGGVADLCLVVAKTGDNGFTRFLVDRSEHGYVTEEIETIGLRGWSKAKLSFDDVWVSSEYVVGDVHRALHSTFHALDRSRVFVALLAVGIAQAAFEEAVAYAKDRHQFGKSIASHQLVQDMVVEMATLLEAARLLAYKALARLGSGDSIALEASMAKQFSTEAAPRIASLAMQIHGASGLSKEFAAERHFRDARMLTIPDGTTQINRLIVARELLGVAAF